MLPVQLHFQTPAFHRCKSKSSLHLQFVAADHCINDNGCADQRQWNESEPNFRAGKILRRDGADLRADGCASVHNQRDQDVDVAFYCVAECAVAGGDDDLEKISTYCKMSGNSQHVDHGWHSNVTC